MGDLPKQQGTLRGQEFVVISVMRNLAPHTQATYILHVSLRIPGEVGH
jgi:hypothetical protein